MVIDRLTLFCQFDSSQFGTGVLFHLYPIFFCHDLVFCVVITLLPGAVTMGSHYGSLGVSSRNRACLWEFLRSFGRGLPTKQNFTWLLTSCLSLQSFKVVRKERAYVVHREVRSKINWYRQLSVHQKAQAWGVGSSGSVRRESAGTWSKTADSKKAQVWLTSFPHYLSDIPAEYVLVEVPMKPA